MRSRDGRLGVKHGSPQHTDNLKLGYADVQAVYEYKDLPRLLATNAVDAVVVPKSVYSELVPQLPPKVVVAVSKPRAIGFYLAKNATGTLLNALNENIVKCRAVTKLN
jgi:ABC-type amino acid transport substrate-binding protein